MTSVSEWQAHLAKLYPNNNKTPDYMMTHLYTACSDIGRTLLRHEGEARRDRAILGALSWMMALASNFDIDYEDAVLTRFPTLCHYCLGRPCNCDATERHARHPSGRMMSPSEAEDERQTKRQIIRNQGTKIDFEWISSQLRAIYPGNRTLLSKGGEGYITGKLLEEGGELHRAYSEYMRGQGKKERISAELADLTAWVVSCWNTGGQSKSLQAEFASEYGRSCPTCSKNPCACVPYTITPGQEEIIKLISDKLTEASSTSPGLPIIRDAMALTQEVSINPSPEKKRKLIEKLRDVSEAVKIARGTMASGEGIVTSIAKYADALSDLVN